MVTLKISDHDNRYNNNEMFEICRKYQNVTQRHRVINKQMLLEKWC